MLIAAEAVVVLTWSTIAVRTLGSQRLMRLIGTVNDAPGPTLIVTGQGRRVGRIVERVASVLPWQPVCLPQAIAVRTMLRRRGVRSTLHLGVVSGEALSAHAWVTVGQAIVQGDPIGAAVEVARFR
jgi:hypothetical protein